MSRFQVVLAGFVAAAATGAICALLAFGEASDVYTDLDSGTSLEDVWTLVLAVLLVAALGVAVGVVLGVLPTVVVTLAWGRLQRAAGPRVVPVVIVAVFGLVFLEVLAGLLLLRGPDTLGGAAFVAFVCAGVASVVSAVVLRAAGWTARGTRVEITRY